MFYRTPDHALPGEIAALENMLGLPPAPRSSRLEDQIRVNRQYFRVLAARALGRMAGVPVLDSALSLTVIRANGQIQPLGIVCRQVVTNAGVAYLVDAFQNLVEPEDLKYHGTGSSGAAEAVTDTALGAEFTTQVTPDNTRATGSTTEAAANIYRTVGTNTYDAAADVREHGIFNRAATGGGTLLDRSVFGVLSLASGDSLQSTYDLTLNAGG
jgi:hypothetical protein